MAEPVVERYGRGSIKTFTGRYVFPLDPNPDDIVIEDIAHALSNQCRFSGHTSEFYSVAQHSVHVAEEIRARDCSLREILWGLLHDAAEAYLVDLPKPLKQMAGFGDHYRAAEGALMLVITKVFGLPAEEPPIVKEFDRTLLCTEARDLMGHIGEPWYPGNLLPERIRCWEPAVAEVRFLDLYWELAP